ncbi:type IV secretory system conjugative DNA transfer family protein [Rhodococcus sp. HS-D2]|uniref:type IV secretory system conjugative DNA transfer family protein n=1 Tax=Rhodococcus sp. HS-D2 TaxID=1384636 RepID=UPI0018D3CACD|nr:type IV secretory system conjugative DNA transfer family protein [Rhodococcus sp. HS-D2]
MPTSRGGGHWIALALFSPLFLIARIAGGFDLVIIAICAMAALMGVREQRNGAGFAYHRWISVGVVTLLATYLMIGYAAGYAVSRLFAGRSLRLPLPRLGGRGRQAPTSERGEILAAKSPIVTLATVAERAWGKPAGGHVGWDDTGHYLGANPRGGMLVIGPPGSGKSSGVIIPSVLVAPWATVVATIKLDLMMATALPRAAVGRVWHFDPGGGEHTPPGVLQARWSPLVSIRSWDDARIIANRLAEPSMKKSDDSVGGGDHFTERARDWLEVLLYAASLGDHPISTVADWAQNPDAEDVQQDVESELIFAASNGDQGAKIAAGQLAGLLATPDKERGSVKSTLARLVRIYGSVAAREIGANPNFDPREFVRTADTLYITASPERQKEYAPLLAGLLEEIRYATYERHAAEEQGTEPKRPHVTFVLDEANNTAPIPLPAIISEAGGQSLHVIVGIQDLSRARSRWGRDADGFLTLFPTKVVLNGVVEPYTLDALSNASGEYDRMMASYSESTTFIGPYSFPIRQRNPSYSMTRQKVLNQGDIANLPPGRALLFEGAEWWLVNLGMHHSDPVWQTVQADAARYGEQMLAAEDPQLHDSAPGRLEA